MSGHNKKTTKGNSNISSINKQNLPTQTPAKGSAESAMKTPIPVPQKPPEVVTKAKINEKVAKNEDSEDDYDDSIVVEEDKKDAKVAKKKDFVEDMELKEILQKVIMKVNELSDKVDNNYQEVVI